MWKIQKIIPTELLDIKNPVSKIKNTLYRISSRLDTEEEKNSELEDIAI